MNILNMSYKSISEDRIIAKERFTEIKDMLDNNISSMTKDEINRVNSYLEELKRVIIGCERALKDIDKAIGNRYRNGTYA